MAVAAAVATERVTLTGPSGQAVGDSGVVIVVCIVVFIIVFVVAGVVVFAVVIAFAIAVAVAFVIVVFVAIASAHCLTFLSPFVDTATRL